MTDNSNTSFLDDLKVLVGWEATLQIVDAYGGKPMLIPSTARDSNILARLIGSAATAKLIAQYGGTKPYIPKVPLRQIRNREIHRKFHIDQIPAYKIGEEFDLSERQIWYILKRPEPTVPTRADSPQGAFDF